MTEEKTGQQDPTTPYDLWPTEHEVPAPVAESVFAPQSTDLPDNGAASIYHSPFAPIEDKPEAPFEAPFVPVSYTPETPDEAIRQRGLAFSVGVVFFGSVAFMLFLGWLADLILGSSPWGVVIGIILGAIIGFLQFFRITSQIFKNSADIPKQNPLSSHRDDNG